MSITYHKDGVAMPRIGRKVNNAWIKAVAESHCKKVGEIAYIFVNDTKIRELNKQYLNRDWYTDIITFDYCEGDEISGDIFISLDTVRDNAQRFEQAYSDELKRVIIHGILHLCGINDETSQEQDEMRYEEDRALSMIQNCGSIAR